MRLDVQNVSSFLRLTLQLADGICAYDQPLHSNDYAAPSTAIPLMELHVVWSHHRHRASLSTGPPLPSTMYYMKHCSHN